MTSESFMTINSGGFGMIGRSGRVVSSRRVSPNVAGNFGKLALAGGRVKVKSGLVLFCRGSRKRRPFGGVLTTMPKAYWKSCIRKVEGGRFLESWGISEPSEKEEEKI